MAGDVEAMRAALVELEPVTLEIIDDSHLHAGHAGASSGGHYRLYIVSARFVGKSTLERHRMVYSALHAMMQRGIHALNIQAVAPDEA